jgi:hypothetical protein
MDAKTFGKSKLPSRHLTEGPSRAPHRSPSRARITWDTPPISSTSLAGGCLHEDCLTVTGKTIKQNLEKMKFNKNQKVVYQVAQAISPTGGVVGLQAEVVCYADI